VGPVVQRALFPEVPKWSATQRSMLVQMQRAETVAASCDGVVGNPAATGVAGAGARPDCGVQRPRVRRRRGEAVG
jgi:hypothetical protein